MAANQSEPVPTTGALRITACWSPDVVTASSARPFARRKGSAASGEAPGTETRTNRRTPASRAACNAPEHRPVVRLPHGVLLRLVGATHEVDEREHAAEHLGERVGIVEPPDRDLGAEGAEGLRLLGTPDRSADLVLAASSGTRACPIGPEAPVTMTVMATMLPVVPAVRSAAVGSLARWTVPTPTMSRGRPRALGAEPVAWRPVTRGGQTAASRWVVDAA